MSDAKHDGIRRMENGVIGEARARAFLTERFWILDRSVDVDGADMLIQRRLTRLHDKEPPRLGVIQVKFLQDERTTVYIDSAYVSDEKGPLREFFLLAFTGLGDSARAFLLSGKDIADNFKIAPTTHSYAGKYVLGGKNLLAPAYRMDSVTRGLDQIEQALRLADLERNRHYLFYTTPFFARPSREQIESEFLLPLDNWWGDIPEEFLKMKNRAQKALYKIEDFAGSLRNIITASDPETALAIAEDIDDDLQHPIISRFDDQLYDQDMQAVVRRHREQYERLRAEGLLDTFLSLTGKIEAFIIDDLSPRLPVAENHGYLLEVFYDEKSLSVQSFSGGIMPLPEKERDSFWHQGDSLTTLAPGRAGYLWPLNVQGFGSDDSDDRRQAIKKSAWQVRRPMMEAIYEARFPPTPSKPSTRSR